MKYVYSVACHVVVWIGVPDDGMAGFIQKLVGPRSLLSALIEEGVNGFNQAVLYSWRMRDFPWWRRLWVLQEVALASDIFVQPGSAWISFDRLLSELAIVQHFLLRFLEKVENPVFRITAVALTQPNIPSLHTSPSYASRAVAKLHNTEHLLRISSDDFQEHIQLPSIAGEETANNHKDHYVDGSKLKHAYWRTLLHNTIPYEKKVNTRSHFF